MKIKDQKEHVTLLVQCKCIGCSNADRDYGMFSSGEVSGVQEHTQILQHTNCAIHSAKKRIKDIEREKKK